MSDLAEALSEIVAKLSSAAHHDNVAVLQQVCQQCADLAQSTLQARPLWEDRRNDLMLIIDEVERFQILFRNVGNLLISGHTNEALNAILTQRKA